MTHLRGKMAAVAVALAAAYLSACGACWPGSCVDGAAPTPTPTPTPTPDGSVTPAVTVTPSPLPSAVCPIDLDPATISTELWASMQQGCPRLLLSSEQPKADHIDIEGIPSSSICEAGRLTSGEQNTFFFRFSCDAERPWQIAVATPSTEDGDELTLSAVCGELTITETYVQGPALAETLSTEFAAEIAAVLQDFEDACTEAEVGSEAWMDCVRFCSGEDSLRTAVNALQIVDVPTEVDCYFALFDPDIEEFLETVQSEDETLLVESSCLCIPNPEYLDCLLGPTFPCFAADGSYDEACGEECWEDEGTDSPDCE